MLCPAQCVHLEAPEVSLLQSGGGNVAHSPKVLHSRFLHCKGTYFPLYLVSKLSTEKYYISIVFPNKLSPDDFSTQFPSE